MNTCPDCGKIAGLHSSILQGCMCQYSVQSMKEGKDFTINKPWVGLTDKEIEVALPSGIYDCLADPWDCGVGDGDEMRSIKKDVLRIARAIEAKLKEKNT